MGNCVAVLANCLPLRPTNEADESTLHSSAGRGTTDGGTGGGGDESGGFTDDGPPIANCLPFLAAATQYESLSDGAAAGGRRLQNPRQRCIVPSATRCDIRTLYRIGKKIGSGSFASVHQCTSVAQPSQRFACKTISCKSRLRDKEFLRFLRREVSNLQSLSEAEMEVDEGCGQRRRRFTYITKLHDVIEDEQQHKVHMVMELCVGGSLQSMLERRRRRYSEAEAARLMAALLKAVGFCHERGVVHRDIKPDNVLFMGSSDSASERREAADINIRLADFGLSRAMDRQRMGATIRGEVAGTPGYAAPEILRNEPYDYGVDVWSLGAVLYVLLSGYHPFYSSSSDEDDDGRRINRAVLRRNPVQFSHPRWLSISQDAKLLVRQMLCPNPLSRITVAQALLHPWILRHTSSAIAPPPISLTLPVSYTPLHLGAQGQNSRSSSSDRDDIALASKSTASSSPRAGRHSEGTAATAAAPATTPPPPFSARSLDSGGGDGDGGARATATSTAPPTTTLLPPSARHDIAGGHGEVVAYTSTTSTAAVSTPAATTSSSSIDCTARAVITSPISGEGCSPVGGGVVEERGETVKSIKWMERSDNGAAVAADSKEIEGGVWGRCKKDTCVAFRWRPEASHEDVMRGLMEWAASRVERAGAAPPPTFCGGAPAPAPLGKRRLLLL